MAPDDFTSSVDGAAAYERLHGRPGGDDDRPSPSDLAEPFVCPECQGIGTVKLIGPGEGECEVCGWHVEEPER